MSVFQGYDGELRLYSATTIHTATASAYMEVLFCNMDFTGPTSRGKTEEEMIMNRGQFDDNSHYIEGSEHPVFQPMTFTFGCRLADTVNTQALCDWLSGVTTVNGRTIYGWQYDSTNNWGGTTLQVCGHTEHLTPQFEDTSKNRYRVEVLWDGTNDLGYRYEEVYFRPGDVNVTESENAVGISVTGEIYGTVTRITAFSSASDIMR